MFFLSIDIWQEAKIHSPFQKWLFKYGYMTGTGYSTGDEVKPEDLVDRLKTFQEFAGLEITGTEKWNINYI